MKQANLGLNAEQLAARQQWLQHQASRLIGDLDLMKILTMAGEPRLTGSAELGLMVWPDIDLEVVAPGTPKTAAAMEVVRHLMLGAGGRVRRLNVADERQTTRSEIPHGIYIWTASCATWASRGARSDRAHSWTDRHDASDSACR